MTSSIKVNNINMFVNKLNFYDQMVDLNLLKENFELGNGFLRISYAKRVTAGNSTVNVNYNRPGIGPIQSGLYCNKCSQLGPESHTEGCPNPTETSLYLTFSGFHELVMKAPNPPMEFLELKTSIINKKLTQEIFDSKIILNKGIQVQNGTIDFSKIAPGRPSRIPFYKFIVKRGRTKLARKTITTEFLNSVMIYYSSGGVNTSIRVTKNGTINLINIPQDPIRLSELIKKLIERIFNTKSVDLQKFIELTSLDSYQMIHDVSVSYVHSINAQFELIDVKKLEIDFENLNSLIAPVGPDGITATRFTQIETLRTGTKIIKLGELKIIEWSYVIGKISRSDTPTKEYIKFVVIPAPGVKMTGIINRFGSVVLSLSICKDDIEICGDGTTPLSLDLIIPTQNTFVTLFRENRQLFFKKSLKNIGLKEIPTIDGYVGEGRQNRARYMQDGTKYEEFMYPTPYSWKGRCSDPNYLILDPIGKKDPKTGLYYPYCTKATESLRKQMEMYLKLGFPKGATALDKQRFNLEDITEDNDPGSGITARITRDNSTGDTVEIKTGDIWETVTIINKIQKPGNIYRVLVNETGVVKDVPGSSFRTESRFFKGLLDFIDKEKKTAPMLISCIKKFLHNSNFRINESGQLIFNVISELNESPNQTLAVYFRSLLSKPIFFKELTTYNLSLLSTNHIFRYVPSDSYHFYLVLSRTKGNFFINNYLNYIPCELADTEDILTEIVILNGYLKLGDSEGEENAKYLYDIIDLIFAEGLLTERSFVERNAVLNELRLKLENLLGNFLTLNFPTYSTTDDLRQDVKFIASSEENSYRFLFIDKQNINNGLIWNPNDESPDKIELQVISFDNTMYSVQFGYEDRTFDEIPGLSFISPYKFFEQTKTMLERLGIVEGDYVIIKINRDGDGKIVPNRKISIEKKVQRRNSTYNSAVNQLLKKFNPINISFFADDPRWESFGLIQN